MFEVGSAWGQILSVVQNLSQLIFYYIQDSIVELNIYEANRVHSIQGLSRLAGHNPTRVRSAQGELQLTFVKDGSQSDIEGGFVYVLNYTKVRCVGDNGNNLIYTVILPTDEIRLSTNPRDTSILKVVEGVFETEIRTGTGLPLQSFTISTKPAVEIENDYVNVKVNGKDWTRYDSLYDMPRGAEGYIVKTGIVSGIDIFFGNGSFGLPPEIGSEISIEYLVSNGISGNLRLQDNILFKFEDSGFDVRGNEVDLNNFYFTKMRTDFSFGAPRESVEFTRLIAPKTSRSFVLANPTNYITFFEKFNLFGVIDAWVNTDRNRPDKDNIVYVLLIPDVVRFLTSDVNYFTAPENAFVLTPELKHRLEELVELSGQRVNTNELLLVEPVIRRYIMNIQLAVFVGYDDNLIKNKILEKLSDYFLNIRRRDKIPRSDLITIVETVEGVDWVDVTFCGELNEQLQIATPDSPTVGLDKNGNIVIERGEYPIIRGGWVDRNGVFYEETPSFELPSSVNISIIERNVETYNTRINNGILERVRQ
jgi:hypothetical protein